MKVLFIEPPREFWFVMGEYLPPPFGIIQLAAYLEREVKDVEIEVLDCTAQQLGWSEIGRKIESFNPDIVGASAFATCNVYLVLRTLEIAKGLDPEILTVTGACMHGAGSITAIQKSHTTYNLESVSNSFACMHTHRGTILLRNP